MQREIYQQLLAWKASDIRKPLLLQGARQVGKTFLMERFGEQEYRHVYYFNLERDPTLPPVFEGSISPSILLEKLSLLRRKKITAKDTLLIFDEIQAVPRALTSLKYFYEESPEFHIIAAGSLLGVKVGKTSSFPVGKVNFLTLYPLSFKEFLQANGETLLVDWLSNRAEETAIEPVFHNRLSEQLKYYLFLGGMPEVVQHYIKHQDIAVARELQQGVLDAYLDDFSKYSEPTQATRTHAFWDSIPYQLARENKKFKYGSIKAGSRAATFELTIDWLKNAGLIYPAYQLSAPKLPLGGYADLSNFKVYLLDTGLLGAMLNLDPSIILHPTALFKEYFGAFMENYVAAELIKLGTKKLYYWTRGRSAEVDFIVQHKNTVYPLEVKSGTSTNLKSLRLYIDKYQPKLSIRLSPRNFVRSEQFINLPLYATFLLPALFDRQGETPWAVDSETPE